MSKDILHIFLSDNKFFLEYLLKVITCWQYRLFRLYRTHAPLKKCFWKCPWSTPMKLSLIYIDIKPTKLFKQNIFFSRRVWHAFYLLSYIQHFFVRGSYNLSAGHKLFCDILLIRNVFSFACCRSVQILDNIVLLLGENKVMVF